MYIDKSYNVIKEGAYTQVGAGWHSLLDTFYSAVAEDPNVYVIQVKEKFGGLRIYFDHCCIDISKSDEELENYICNHDCASLYNLVRDLEEKSITICEDCGQAGELRMNRSWIKTLCNTCMNEGH